MRNNARTQIVGNIGASDTTLIVKTGEGLLFGTDYPIKATLEQYTNQVVNKREIINITGITGDVFTITRAVEECVQNDSVEPKTRTQDQYSFQDGDFLSVYVTEDYYTDIKLNKLNKTGGIRDGLTADSISYVDDEGNESFLEYDKVADNGKAVIISETEGLSLESPGVNIGGLDAVTTLTATDEFIVNQSGNKKITRTNLTRSLDVSTETNLGVVERATDAEAEAGTDTTRYISPKQAKDNYGVFRKIQQADFNGTATITLSVPGGVNKRFMLVYEAYASNSGNSFNGIFRINGLTSGYNYISYNNVGSITSRTSQNGVQLANAYESKGQIYFSGRGYSHSNQRRISYSMNIDPLLGGSGDICPIGGNVLTGIGTGGTNISSVSITPSSSVIVGKMTLFEYVI